MLARVGGLMFNCERRLGNLETTRRKGGKLTWKRSEKQTCLLFTPYQLRGAHVFSFYWLSANQYNTITLGIKKNYTGEYVGMAMALRRVSSPVEMLKNETPP